MSKRIHIVEKEATTLQLPDELWLVIGGFIAWHDIETLRNFISVCQNAICFVQPTVRVLFTKLLEIPPLKRGRRILDYENREAKRLRRAYVRERSDEPYLEKCLLRYISATVATLSQWREWSSSILETLQLLSLFEKRLYDKSGETVFQDRRCKDITPETMLNRIYYAPTNGNAAQPLHKVPIVRCVRGMYSPTPFTLISEARRVINETMPESLQQVYLEALGKGIQLDNRTRAICYYALSKTLKIDEPCPSDRFKDVVLANPSLEDDFLHIYSPRSEFVTKFIKECILYMGKPEHAVVTFHLYYRQKRYTEEARNRCMSVFTAIKAAQVCDTVVCK